MRFFCFFNVFPPKLAGQKIRRTASFRTTPYGQEGVIDTEGYAASMGRQVRSTVTLSKTQQPLCSYVTDRLQGALNPLCDTECVMCVPIVFTNTAACMPSRRWRRSQMKTSCHHSPATDAAPAPVTAATSMSLPPVPMRYVCILSTLSLFRELTVQRLRLDCILILGREVYKCC
jgi:hypothetical protein